MEVYVLINKKKGIGVYILDSLVLVLLVAALLLSCLVPYVMLVMIILGSLFYCGEFHTNIEYENK